MAVPIRPMVPIGASRMIHHSAFWSSVSTDSPRPRIGSAFSPSLSAAIPTTTAMKTIWSTFSSVNGVITSVGMIPVRKSSQDPWVSGLAASAAERPVPEPGLVTRPMASPIATAISEVAMNQSRVRVASRAALCTLRRLVIEMVIAKNTSGATASFSSWTKISPILVRVVPSQATSQLRAAQPRTTPRTRPSRIWAQNGTLGMRAVRSGGVAGSADEEDGEGDGDDGDDGDEVTDRLRVRQEADSWKRTLERGIARGGAQGDAVAGLCGRAGVWSGRAVSDRSPTCSGRDRHAAAPRAPGRGGPGARRKWWLRLSWPSR